MKKILILHVKAGYGHFKVAEAIGNALKTAGLVDVTVEVADALQWTPKSFSFSYPKIYLWMVMNAPWLWGFFFYLTNWKPLYWLIRPLRYWWNYFYSRQLRKMLIDGHYDLLVFTHFFPAEVAAALKRKGKIKSVLLTVVTDVIPHYVWQNSGTDYYWVMAEESKVVLEQNGIPSERIFSNGIPVARIFEQDENRQGLERKIGLEPKRFNILFTSGSFGIGPTEAILMQLNSWKSRVQAIVICGKNEVLKGLLDQKKHLWKFPVHIFGFIDNMHEFMSVSDLSIAKPGGATMCEGLSKSLPTIITSPIPGQETFNVLWLMRHGAAFEIKKPQEAIPIIKRSLEDPCSLKKTKENIAGIAKPNATADLVRWIKRELNI